MTFEAAFRRYLQLLWHICSRRRKRKTVLWSNISSAQVEQMSSFIKSKINKFHFVFGWKKWHKNLGLTLTSSIEPNVKSFISLNYEIFHKNCLRASHSQASMCKHKGVKQQQCLDSDSILLNSEILLMIFTHFWKVKFFTFFSGLKSYRKKGERERCTRELQ